MFSRIRRSSSWLTWFWAAIPSALPGNRLDLFPVFASHSLLCFISTFLWHISEVAPLDLLCSGSQFTMQPVTTRKQAVLGRFWFWGVHLSLLESQRRVRSPFCKSAPPRLSLLAFSSSQRLATVSVPQLPVNHCVQLTGFVCLNSTAKLKASVLSMWTLPGETFCQ